MCSASMGAEGSVTLQLREAVQAPESGASIDGALTIGYPDSEMLADMLGSLQAAGKLFFFLLNNICEITAIGSKDNFKFSQRDSSYKWICRPFGVWTNGLHPIKMYLNFKLTTFVYTKKYVNFFHISKMTCVRFVYIFFFTRKNLEHGIDCRFNI